MTSVLIIEDEKLAAERLVELLGNISAEYKVTGIIDSVENAVKELKKTSQPDLIFLDIHLADGNSFEIFKDVEIDSSIIFCTAYDQYAIKAFKVNSVDYLLKPIDEDELKNAIEKYEKLAKPTRITENLEQLISSFNKAYKSRFVIRVGEHLKAVEVDQVHFFYSEEKMTFLQTGEGKHYIIDYPLDKVESMVDPSYFFRINRKYLVSFPAIKDMLNHSNSRLRLVLTHSDDQDVIVSRERVNDFKAWLDR